MKKYKQSLFEKIIDFQVSSKFSLKDKIFFLRELSYLIEWWVNLPTAIDTIYKNTENTKLQYICDQVNKIIKKWEPLSKALMKLDEYFNEWDVNIIRSGEWTWKLSEVLKHLANQYENLHIIRQKYIWALLYPAILIVIIILALYMIFALILPWFIDIINSFPWVNIPWSTQVLIMIEKFFSQNWWTVAMWIVVAIIIFWLFLSTKEWKEWFDRKIIKLPLIWKIVRLYLLVKFLRYFSLLLESGISIVNVFKYLKWIMKHSVYEQMCDESVRALQKWESIIPILRYYMEIIPSDVVVLLKVWEETAAMTKAAKNAITLYEEEFNKIVDNLSKIIEPILIIFIWWVIWILALSIFSVIISVIWGMEKVW